MIITKHRRGEGNAAAPGSLCAGTTLIVSPPVLQDLQSCTLTWGNRPELTSVTPAEVDEAGNVELVFRGA